LAIIHHHTRGANGAYVTTTHTASPMDFVIKHVPDGVPVRVYAGEIGEDTDVTEDFDALKKDGVFHVVEGAGGGVVKGIFGVFGAILRPILKLFSPKPAAPEIANQQGDSPNNSLTDRSNKPRPYARVYDICGTVQSIPNDLMSTYRLFDIAGNVIEFGYYVVGRGPLYTPASGITDGDTLLSEITGSSAAVYGPYTSPNNGAPQTVINGIPDEGLYITAISNEIDGQVLRAPNDLSTTIVGGFATAEQIGGVTGIITDPTGDADFSDFVRVGELAKLTNIAVDVTGITSSVVLDGVYTVTAVSAVDIRLNISTNNAEWLKLGVTPWLIKSNSNALIGPNDTYAASLTDWVTIQRIKPERVVANVTADNGMYKSSGSRSKQRAVVVVELQYQLLDDDELPIGDIYTAQGTISGRSADLTGVSIIAELPYQSAVRVRMRRVTNLDLNFNGTVVDEVKYTNLYGQIRDLSPDYGNLTTVHTARRQTARATAVRQPQLRLVVTEMLYKYLGNGVFDNVLSQNTSGIQSLIRLMNDSIIGNLQLSADNMDKLLAVDNEIATYFGTAAAAQFCYTFDSYTTTAQDIISIIADAIFCTSYRRGKAIYLDFERPRLGPEMVFTHRSKTPAGEKWARRFSDRTAYDSVKYSYIDPDTNIKETITIPPLGGVKTDAFDSKGVRNYQQAFWHAWRRYQKNKLSRVTVDFTATEEGIFVIPGRPISVVKGSRVAPYDGYVIAVNGLTLTLSQPVTFTQNDDHYIILKKRDGTTQSIAVEPGAHDRQVVLQSAPAEAVYIGNSALKTEFSFGSEERHKAQIMIASTVEPGGDRTVKIVAYNYTPDYYLYDNIIIHGRAFSTGFSNGFS
jgi:hypothetical protein